METAEFTTRMNVISFGAQVESAVGEYLAKLEQASNRAVCLDGSIIFQQALRGDVCNLGDLELIPIGVSCNLHQETIDARRPIPGQIANQLRQWARELESVAVRVDEFAAQSTMFEPLTHHIVDMATGETIQAGGFYRLAESQMVATANATGRQFKLITSPLVEWPSQMDDFANSVAKHVIESIPQLVTQAMKEADNGK